MSVTIEACRVGLPLATSGHDIERQLHRTRDRHFRGLVGLGPFNRETLDTKRFEVRYQRVVVDGRGTDFVFHPVDFRGGRQGI